MVIHGVPLPSGSKKSSTTVAVVAPTPKVWGLLPLLLKICTVSPFLRLDLSKLSSKTKVSSALKVSPSTLYLTPVLYIHELANISS